MEKPSSPKSPPSQQSQKSHLQEHDETLEGKKTNRNLLVDNFLKHLGTLNRDPKRKPFHDPSSFSFTKVFESNYKIIAQEFENMYKHYSDAILPWPETNLYEDKSWKVFGLLAFGRKIKKNIDICPKTWKLVEENLPGCTVAGFSILLPGCHIEPHVGYTGYADNILRFHLGIKIPTPATSCAIRVASQEKSWELGKALIFDDTMLHEAWNKHSDSIRVVLLCDFNNKVYEKLQKDPTFIPDPVQAIDISSATFTSDLKKTLNALEEDYSGD